MATIVYDTVTGVNMLDDEDYSQRVSQGVASGYDYDDEDFYGYLDEDELDFFDCD